MVKKGSNLMIKKFKQENLSSDELADLLKELVGMKITSMYDELIVLEDGTRIEIDLNEGCGGCSSGWSELSIVNAMNSVDLEAAIMNVEYAQDNGSYDKFKIFIYLANNETIELDGDDGFGNGYYGSGFWVTVK